jgi:hypothetical protein
MKQEEMYNDVSKLFLKLTSQVRTHVTFALPAGDLNHGLTIDILVFKHVALYCL